MPSRLQHVLGEGHHRWVVIVVALLVVAFGITLCWRGIVLSDEGYLLLQALDLRDGSVLYRDMDAFVTPGIWLLLAGLFSVVEPSVFAARFLALFCYLATIAISYLIILRLASRAYALAGVVTLTALSVWAFPAWTFSFYSPFAVMFALFAMERVLAWSRSQRTADLFWVGLLLGLSISFKQNYGAYALLGAVIAIIAIHRETCGSWGPCLRKVVSDSWPVAAGLAAIGIPLIAYFVYEGAFSQLFDSLVVRPFVFAGLHDIAYPGISRAWDPTFMQNLVERLTYGAYALYHTPPPLGLTWLTPVAQRLHVLLYWIPPLLLAGGLVLSFLPKPSTSRIDTDLFTVIAMSSFLFLGVLPRADFNHLINVYQPIAITGAIVTHRLVTRYPAPRSWRINFALGFGSVFLALYMIVAGSWYASLVRSMTQEVAVPRGGVLLDPLEAELLAVQIKRIQAMTAPGEPVLTVPDLAMLNFLAERPMPSRYYNLYEHHISHDRGAEVVEASEQNGVELAVVRMNNFFSDRTGLRQYAPNLSNYLKDRFDIDYVMGRDGILFLKKRENPRAARDGADALANCEDLDPEIYGGHVIATHLLFDALYLYPGNGGPPMTAEARCPVFVPEQGELAMRIGFLQPEKVDPDTWAVAEVLALRNGEMEPIFIKMFTVTPRGFMEWGKDPYPEFRADLSHLAGEEVTLVFRTTRSGNMHFGFMDVSSFAMTWEDPRIERAAPAR